MQQPNRVLIIDDDPLILDIYTLKFKEQGFEVEIATTGKEGLKMAKEYRPDAILLDIVMPAIDGFEILQELKKDKTAYPSKVVLLTNLGQREEVERGKALGADDYIIKAHFTPSEVVDKVKNTLNKNAGQ